MSVRFTVRIVTTCALGFALSGCATSARMTVTQPGQPPPFDQLPLRGKWAFFAPSPQADRILLAFAHTGAVDGRRQYFLYLLTPPEKGTHTFGAAAATTGADTDPAGAEPLEPTPNDRVRGFYLQSQGPLAGLTRLVSGTLRVGGSPFDGGKLRIGRFELLCADGTELDGRFIARQDLLEMRAFEEDLYPADVQILTGKPSYGQPPAPPASSP